MSFPAGSESYLNTRACGKTAISPDFMRLFQLGNQKSQERRGYFGCRGTRSSRNRHPGSAFTRQEPVIGSRALRLSTWILVHGKRFWGDFARPSQWSSIAWQCFPTVNIEIRVSRLRRATYFIFCCLHFRLCDTRQVMKVWSVKCLFLWHSEPLCICDPSVRIMMWFCD